LNHLPEGVILIIVNRKVVLITIISGLAIILVILLYFLGTKHTLQFGSSDRGEIVSPKFPTKGPVLSPTVAR
jgi:hypothetical protein